jgi:hypothetical protein
MPLPDLNDNPLRSWVSHHDNGWVAHADERPDGTWAAWAVAGGEVVPGPDYIEMDDLSAKAAADFALREKSGHKHCSGGCAGWELHTHGG